MNSGYSVAPDLVQAQSRQKAFRALQSQRGRLTPPALTTALLGSLLLGIGTGSSQAESVTNSVRLQLMIVESDFRALEQIEAEARRFKDQERARIPGYNAALAQVLVEFQKHIVDMHQRHVTCKTCKDYAKRVKQFAKKIEKAMK